MDESVHKVGCFRVLRDIVLGSGGQGSVYKAVCEREGFAGLASGTVVALKVIVAQGDSDGQYARLVRRMEELVAIDNPRIVRYFGCFRERSGFSDLHVVVMEFLEGETLKDRLLRCPRGLDPAEAHQIARWTVEGLEHLSVLGIVHRDVKPGNIFLCADGGVKLIDFGVASRENAGTMTTTTACMVGTYDYMAPDFLEPTFRGDEQSDIFSFGVCLHEMFTGRTPYRNVVPQAVQSDFRFLSRWHDGGNPLWLNPDLARINPALLRIVRRLLAVERRARYASFREVWVDLWGLGDSDGDEATCATAFLPESGFLPTGRHGTSKRGRRAGWWLAVALGLLAGFAGVWLQMRDEVRSFLPEPGPTPGPVAAVTNLVRRIQEPAKTNAPARITPPAQVKAPPAREDAPPKPIPPDPAAVAEAETALAELAAEADVLRAEELVAAWQSKWRGRLAPDDFALWDRRLADALKASRMRIWAEEAEQDAGPVANAYLEADSLQPGDEERTAWLERWSGCLPAELLNRFTNEFERARVQCESRARQSDARQEAGMVVDTYQEAVSRADVELGNVRRRKWLANWRERDLPAGEWKKWCGDFARAQTEAEKRIVPPEVYATVVRAERELAIAAEACVSAFSFEKGDAFVDRWLRKWSVEDLPNEAWQRCTAKIADAKRELRRRVVERRINELTETFVREREQLDRHLKEAERPGAMDDPTVYQLRLHFLEENYSQRVKPLKVSERELRPK